MLFTNYTNFPIPKASRHHTQDIYIYTHIYRGQIVSQDIITLSKINYVWQIVGSKYMFRNADMDVIYGQILDQMYSWILWCLNIVKIAYKLICLQIRYGNNIIITYYFNIIYIFRKYMPWIAIWNCMYIVLAYTNLALDSGLADAFPNFRCQGSMQ